MMSDHVLLSLESYWRGTLETAATKEVEAHLAECDDCRVACEHVGLAIGALGAWAVVAPIPAALEERIVRRVRGPGAWHRYRWAAAVLFALASGAAGYFFGKTSGDKPVAVDSSMHRYILLLEEPDWPPEQPLSRTRTGYFEWTAALRRDARHQGAEKLTEDPGVRVGRGGASTLPARAPNVSGWYLVLARDYDDAVQVARSSPHLNYGSILVRQVE